MVILNTQYGMEKKLTGLGLSYSFLYFFRRLDYNLNYNFKWCDLPSADILMSVTQVTLDMLFFNITCWLFL